MRVIMVNVQAVNNHPYEPSVWLVVLNRESIEKNVISFVLLTIKKGDSAFFQTFSSSSVTACDGTRFCSNPIGGV